jgi:hypothetical protein
METWPRYVSDVLALAGAYLSRVQPGRVACGLYR